MRFAANVAIMVFATLAVAAVAYGGMASQLRRTVPNRAGDAATRALT